MREGLALCELVEELKNLLDEEDVHVTDDDIEKELKHVHEYMPEGVDEAGDRGCGGKGPSENRPPMFIVSMKKKEGKEGKKADAAIKLWKETLAKYFDRICGQDEPNRQWAAAVAILKARAKKHEVNIGI